MRKSLKELLELEKIQEKMPETAKLEALKNLNELAVSVTQNKATEKPFYNSYYDHIEEGIYVDVLSGKPLFASVDKYDAGCGWPSFTKPIEAHSVYYETDKSLFSKRVEVVSAYTDAHLGHVFDDGIEPTGLRYCINSAAMKFIPKDQMKELGYEDYLYIFKKTSK